MRTWTRVWPVVVGALLVPAVSLAPTSPVAADTGCPTAVAFPSGSGTSGSPYVIATPGNLQYLRETPAIWDDNLYYSLTADIAMTGCTWTSGLGQTSLNANGFQGSIDGNGHVISGIAITTTETTVGFISTQRAGSIEDLGLQGTLTVTRSGSGSLSLNVGGLVGVSYVDPGTITRSFTDIDITVNASVVEGNVPNGMPAIQSRLEATIGGIMGTQAYVPITDSYSRGDITITASATKPMYGSSTTEVRLSTGGVVGNNGYPSSVTNSYSTGLVSTTVTATVRDLRIGGFIGRTGESAAGSFWDTTTSTQATGVGMAVGSPILPTGKATAAMKQIGTFTGATWSIDSVYNPAKTWIICPDTNDGYPALMAMQSADVCAPPDVTSVTPSSGSTAGGSSITISGTALANTSSVTIGGAAATIGTTSATSITATTPAGPAGAADVVVTTANGSDTLAGGFTYQAPPTPGGGSGSSSAGGTASSTTPSSTTATPTSLTTTTPALTDPPIVPVALTTPPTPGQATTLVDGQVAESSVQQSGRTTTVTSPQTGTSFSLTAPRSTRTSVPPGVPMPFEFTGGQPGSPVTVHALSEPTLVATAVVDPLGRVSGLISLPTSLPAGAHSLVVSGYSAAGQPVSSYLGIDVAKAPPLRRAAVLFAYGSTTLSAKARSTLNTVVADAAGRSPSTVTVGAVRAVGATAADRALALARARKVAAYLRSAGMPGSVRVGTSIPTSLTTAAARRVDVTVTYR